METLEHPLILWALGLLASLSRALMRRAEETGRRVMPWDWIRNDPAHAGKAVIGSLGILAVLQAGGVFDSMGVVQAGAAFGAGALGVESFDLLLKWARSKARDTLGGK